MQTSTPTVVSNQQVSEEFEQFCFEIYQDPETQRQVYQTPNGDSKELLHHLQSKDCRVVILNDHPIGIFNIYDQKDEIACVGISLHPSFRGQRLAHHLLDEAEKEARLRGVMVIRADVYIDNISSIKTLKAQGFREFIWLEKNLGNPNS
jgi:RimJ/RimL family protein N-acetyltransferase